MNGPGEPHDRKFVGCVPLSQMLSTAGCRVAQLMRAPILDASQACHQPIICHQHYPKFKYCGTLVCALSWISNIQNQMKRDVWIMYVIINSPNVGVTQPSLSYKNRNEALQGQIWRKIKSDLEFLVGNCIETTQSMQQDFEEAISQHQTRTNCIQRAQEENANNTVRICFESGATCKLIVRDIAYR